MAFGLDDAAVATIKEATSAAVKEVAKDVGEVGKDSVSQNTFNPSDFSNSHPTMEGSESDVGEITDSTTSDLTEEPFAPNKFNETTTVQDSGAVEDSTTTIERTSTYEDQTIDNFQLEDQRPEIEEQLNLGKEHDGEVLRGNLEVVTGQNPEASNAHHIVGNDTPRAAEILDKYGIDRNDPANGIFLPDSPESQLKGSIHGQGRHCKEYSNEVEQRFSNVSSREEALEVLNSLKEDLYSGELPLHNDIEPNK